MNIKQNFKTLLFLLLTINIIGQELNGKVEYSFSRLASNNKSSNNKVSQSIKSLNTQIALKSKDLRLQLIFNENISFFTTIVPLGINNQEDKLYELTKLSYRLLGEYFVNKNLNLLITKKELYGNSYLIERKIKTSEWKLINKSEKIGDFTCFKAEREVHMVTAKGKKSRTQVVWYTLDIPLPYGPKDIVGLPGLVIKVIDGGLIYKASKIELNPMNKFKVNTPKKGKKITQEEYDRILEESSNNLKLKLRRRN